MAAKTPRILRELPEPTLRRLPKYRNYLEELGKLGVKTVSCSRIGLDLNLQPIQVRKDLQITGIVGKPRIGYPLADLVAAIESFLGCNHVNEAFLVGAGNLGTALLGYPRFEKVGVNIVAAFDTDPNKIGQWIHQKLVLSLDKLPDLARRMNIRIGILTVPPQAAQPAADLLVESGILAIWNFAPAPLRLPSHIIVHNEDLYSSLAALSCKLAKLEGAGEQAGVAIPHRTDPASPHAEEIIALLHPAPAPSVSPTTSGSPITDVRGTGEMN